MAIDAYEAPINPLYGCRNDMAALRTYLEARAGVDLRLRVLEDDAATRDTFVDRVPGAPRRGRAG